ncbi:lytic murein transglycosylase B [Kaarinaea lacus]
MKSFNRQFLFFSLLCVLVFPVAATSAVAKQTTINFSQNKEVNAFIEEVSKKHGFSQDELKKLFAKVEYKQKIIDAITRPAESKPWYQYRPIFVTDTRIKEGVQFWKNNQKELERAQKEYGVPPEIIVAIIGVETRYGRHKGGHRVMDSLSTLAFGYPKRARFFRSELEEYLLLAREEDLDPLSIKGSYAGAMGKAQFISSSYRHYAVDFDGDGKRDLWNNTSDAIGSVANYFKLHKWQPGGPIATPAIVGSNHIKVLVEKGIKPHSTVADLRKRGVTPKTKVEPDEMGALIELENVAGREYWLGLNNFYVITRYNRSPLYAMAVYQLGQAILNDESIKKLASAKGNS